MSEQQKVFASLSGAVVAHLLLLLFVFVLLGTRSIGSSLSPETRPDPLPEEPQEVTIMMSELMEQIQVEPPEPERFSRPFISTDLNQPELDAPENARFESDRNTRAAAELMPNLDLPQEEGPTTEGESQLPYLRLQKREYVDGELNRPPAMAPASPATAPSPVTPDSLVNIPAEPARAGESGEGEDEEKVEGVDTPPENEVGDQKLRPEESLADGEDAETMNQKSFLDPNSESGLRRAQGEDVEDSFAANSPKEDAEVGEAVDEREKMELAKGGKGDDPEGTADTPPKKRTEEAMPNPADQGIFADGFNPKEIQNTTNGRLTNVGQNAVDAEGTEVGKYKQAVKMAIAKKWHNYRMQHADFVTWGLLKLECRVDRYGNVHGLKLIKNEANSVLADFSLRAILEADLPPMPADVAEELGEDGLQLKYDIIIY